MRTNPERLAWVVLLTSFFVCLTLSVMTPFSARWYVRRSTVTQEPRGPEGASERSPWRERPPCVRRPG